MKSTKTIISEALKAGKNRNYKKSIQLLTDLTLNTEVSAEVYLYLGRAHHAVSDFEKAIRFLSEYTKLLPNQSAGHFFLGRSYLRFGLPQRAIHSIQKALYLDPDNSLIKEYLGLAYLELKKLDPALAYMGQALESQKGNPRLQGVYFHALLAQGVRLFFREDLSMAKQIFEFLHENTNFGLTPALYLGIIAREEGLYEEALSYMDEALSFAPNDATLQLKRAFLLQKIGKTNEAGEIFSSHEISVDYVTTNTDKTVSYEILALEHYKKEEYKKAAFYGVRILRERKGDYATHLMMGECYRNLGSFEKAYNHFKRAKRREPRAVEPRYGIAIVLWLSGEYSQMLEELDHIERLFPDDEVANYYRPLCMSALEYPEEETIPLLLGELKKSKEDYYLMEALADAYMRYEGYREAEIWYKRILEHKPDELSVLKKLITLYEETDDTQNLQLNLPSYLIQNPGDLKRRGEYINIIFQKGEYEETLVQSQEFLTYKPDDLKRKRILAISLRRVGRYKEAAQLYREFLRREPENETFLRSFVWCLEKMGHRKQALDLLGKALNHFKGSATLYLIHGVIAEKEKKIEDALASFRKAADLAPKDFRAFENIGIIYEKLGSNEMAERYRKKAKLMRKKANS